MSKAAYEVKKVIVSGKLKYPKLITPSAPYRNNPGQYEVMVSVSETEFQNLRSQGLSPNAKLQKDDATGETYVKFNRKLKNSKGMDNGPPALSMEDGTPVEGLIGNGSTGRVLLSVVGHDDTSTMKLEAVVITNMVPYVSTNSPEKIQAAHLAELGVKSTGGGIV